MKLPRITFKLYLLLFLFCITKIARGHELNLFTSKNTIDPPLIILLKKLEKYTQKIPQEKVHIHLDKPYYAAGENIWFKAYVTNSNTASSSNLSAMLYVDLIDEKGHIYTQKRVALAQGLGWGDIELKDTLAEGNYRLRAYTTWMQNFEEDYYFDKVLKIGSAWSNKVNVESAFESTIQQEREIIKAQFNLQLKNGKPVINTPITLKILENGEIKEITKITTDANGSILYPFSYNHQNNPISKSIVLEFKLEDNRIVKHIPILLSTDAVDLQFFPEGGQMVAGISGKVAFKAVNKYGKGQAIKGDILDNDKNIIASFESDEYGFGNLYLIPQANQNYIARTIHHQKVFEVKLPPVLEIGYGLSAQLQYADYINIQISSTQEISSLAKSTDSLSLMVHREGYPLLTYQLPANQNSSSVKIPKNLLELGIHTLTLFNASYTPVAERIFFAFNPQNLIQLQTEEIKSNYTTREHVAVNFIGQVINTPVRGHYSVAVTRNEVVSPEELNESHILSSLLLNSELKGHIENPNQYFLQPNLQSNQRLDNLLLTQGWRKINWTAVNNETFPEIKYKSDAKLPITGIVTNMYGSPVADAWVSLFSPNNMEVFDKVKSNKNGGFTFNKFLFMDTTEIVINAARKNGAKDLKVIVDSLSLNYFPRIGYTTDYQLNINTKLKTYLDQSQEHFEELKKQGNLNEVIQLKQVEIIGQYGNKVSASRHSSNLNGAGNADIIIDTRDASPFTPIGSIIHARYNPPRYVSMNLNTKNAMKVFLDGLPVGTYFPQTGVMIAMIPPVEFIRSIEILKPTSNRTSIYGSNAEQGVIIVTTKKGDPDDELPKPKLSKYLVNRGLSVAKEFYSPKHDSPNSSQVDLRSTVYWNPNILSDKEGRFQFNYFNTDEPGTYRMVIEGISETGHLARKVYTYEVK